MGASTKLPRPAGKAVETALATSREEDGSMVEQSMKSRGWGWAEVEPFWPPAAAYAERMESYVALTCFGSGRQVMTVS
jgi:hypothetical protein